MRRKPDGFLLFASFDDYMQDGGREDRGIRMVTSVPHSDELVRVRPYSSPKNSFSLSLTLRIPMWSVSRRKSSSRRFLGMPVPLSSILIKHRPSALSLESRICICRSGRLLFLRPCSMAFSTRGCRIRHGMGSSKGGACCGYLAKSIFNQFLIIH